MCASPSAPKTSAVLHPSLNLPRAAFIRKNTNPVASEYEIGESTIGEGAYSTIIQGTNKYSGIARAIKFIPKTTTDAELFEVELRSLMALDHPHIVKICQYFDEGDHFVIVFEMIDGPDLVQYILQRADTLGSDHVPEKELGIILRQVLKAILSCHEGGIIHRDVKLENFMISGKEMVVKMIDLGLAATKEHPLIAGNSVIGTYRYMAPEIYSSTQGYDKAVDMWALGVSFYTMLTLDTLLPDEEDEVRKLLLKPNYVAQKIKACRVLKERKLSKEARNFLNMLLAYDPQKRITAEDALQHPFIKNSAQVGLTRVQMPNQINNTLPAKMDAFAKAPPLERIGRLAIAHTISQCTDKELIEVRLMFRTLNKSGNGKLSISEIKDGLEQDGFALPPNFGEVLAVCSSSGSETLNFNEFMACNLPDCFLNEQLCATVFRLLDRDGNGLLGPEDLKIMYASGGAKAPELCEDIVFSSTGKTSITSAEFCTFMLD